MGNTQNGGTAAASSWQAKGQDSSSSKRGNKSWATPDHTLSAPAAYAMKEAVQCLCEGGRGCTREDPARQKEANAVPGLHCSWVGQHVLAMARPWQDNVVKFDLVNKFKDLNIGMIINLQEVGEHDGCGPGNYAASGFSYIPETFMAERIGVYNICWRDMGVPTLDKMMDIVQVMHYAISVEKKRIAVHCHAGLGRTGLTIACFLVACGEAANATQAVEMVRAARPGSLQTQAQVMFVSIFEQYLQHLRCLFKVADLHKLNLGNEGYILTKVCRRLSRNMSGARQPSSDPVADAKEALSSMSGCGAAVAADGSTSISIATAAGLGLAPSAGGAAAPLGDEWACATYERMSAAEAAAMPSTAEAAANAALNLQGNGDAVSVVHAKRLSGGGASMKLMCNLKAIKEESDKPVHVISTETAVTEVYGDGLTIIRSAHSCKRLQGVAPLRPSIEQQLDRLPNEKDLGLHTKAWNDTFHIEPSNYNAEGWLPDAPKSYLEALNRQKRLLHGMERRQSLRLHKLLKAAAKALTQAATAYNAVLEHWDSSASGAAAAAGSSASSQMRRCHTRSRSSAAADLLSLTSNLTVNPGPVGGGVGSSSSSQPSTPVKSMSSKALRHTNSGNANAAAAAAVLSGLNVINGAAGSSAAATPGASLLPGGIHLSAPGTSPGNSGASTRASSSGGGNGCDTHLGSCLAGCCAPSFAAGLLTALVYKGRFPEELEQQWAGCPRLQAMGFTEGHAMCSQLQAVKLALNAGNYAPLESASAAVAVVVLADWFAGFVSESLSEASLGLLVEEAESLLKEAAAAAAAQAAAASAAAARDLQKSPQPHEQAGRQRSSGRMKVPKLKLAHMRGDQRHSKSGGGSRRSSRESSADGQAGLDEDSLLVHKAAARAVACAMHAHEQDLLLVLAAVLRHVRHASIDDSRLHSWMLGSGGSSWQQQEPGKEGAGRPSMAQEDVLGMASVLGVGSMSGSGAAGAGAGQLPQQRQGSLGLMQPPQQAVVDGEVDGAMQALYRLMAGWLLGPMALACPEALDATAAFLQYLTVDDTGYSQLLQASREQGLRKSHGQSANCSFDSLESLISNSSSGSSTPRSRLRARLLKSALASSLQSCPGQGSMQGKSKSKLRHASSSPEIAKQVQFHTEQLQGCSESRSASPAGSDGGWPSRLGHCSSTGHCASKKNGKGDVGSLTGLLSSLFGARKQQPQQSRAGMQGMQGGAKQLQEQGAQTGSSLPGARVTKEETSQSQVEEAGQRALCVGRQNERAAAEDMSVELAQLTGRPQSLTQTPRPHDFFLLAPEAAAGISTAAAELNGSLSSPPKSISPVALSANSNSTLWSNPLSKSSAHHHLPAIRLSAAGMAAAGLSPSAAEASSNTSSMSASPTHSLQLAAGGLGQQQQQLHAVDAASAAASAGSSFSAACTPGSKGVPGSSGVAEAATAAAQGVSAAPSSIDVGASQLLSVSALSDLQLPSFPSSMSVADSHVLRHSSRLSWEPSAQQH